jgi:hypothetical protein
MNSNTRKLLRKRRVSHLTQYFQVVAKCGYLKSRILPLFSGDFINVKNILFGPKSAVSLKLRRTGSCSNQTDRWTTGNSLSFEVGNTLGVSISYCCEFRYRGFTGEQSKSPKISY